MIVMHMRNDGKQRHMKIKVDEGIHYGIKY